MLQFGRNLRRYALVSIRNQLSLVGFRVNSPSFTRQQHRLRYTHVVVWLYNISGYVHETIIPWREDKKSGEYLARKIIIESSYKC